MSSSHVWQPSLLDDGPPTVPASFEGMRRLHLDERSWVDYCPGWLSGADAVFEELSQSARWQQRTVKMWDRVLPEPRMTAGWSTDSTDVETPEILRVMCSALTTRYAVAFDRVWVNLYRDGNDSVAWHGDRNRHVVTKPMVCTVSLGARRRFLLRRRGTTKTVHAFEPGCGDLIVMGGACQVDWEHTVPKTARQVNARMSVTIRHSQPAAGERWLKQPVSTQPGQAW